MQVDGGVLRFIAVRDRVFATTGHIFLIWLFLATGLLLTVAILFIRNQVKPIRRLAHAAENFGKGRDVSNFKPEGATEVRQAAQAFMAMRERIQRQITQRTDMLSGVSHDLRTPLTRMKLQLAMLQDIDGAEDLSADVSEMEHMLEGYLAFARGEGTEKPAPTDLGDLLEDVVGQIRRRGRPIDLHLEDRLHLPLRPNAFKRCVTNLVENALNHGGGDAVEVVASLAGDHSAPYVVLKGGHLRGDTCPDLLATPNGHQWLPASRIATENLHGTGCALSSAITACLAKLPEDASAEAPEQAITEAKQWLHHALAASHRLSVGKGRGPVHHFHAWW